MRLLHWGKMLNFLNNRQDFLITIHNQSNFYYSTPVKFICFWVKKSCLVSLVTIQFYLCKMLKIIYLSTFILSSKAHCSGDKTPASNSYLNLDYR